VLQGKDLAGSGGVSPGPRQSHTGLAMATHGLAAASEYTGTEEALERCFCQGPGLNDIWSRRASYGSGRGP
jgi:hypothetical protein